MKTEVKFNYALNQLMEEKKVIDFIDDLAYEASLDDVELTGDENLEKFTFDGDKAQQYVDKLVAFLKNVKRIKIWANDKVILDNFENAVTDIEYEANSMSEFTNEEVLIPPKLFDKAADMTVGIDMYFMEIKKLLAQAILIQDPSKHAAIEALMTKADNLALQVSQFQDELGK